ncbi:DNA-binding response regulator [Brevibacillus fluminis]|uniref:DNA-binding response regulator n=1 Tax=Brevibacillus fluminis TaxID=511487 RepID=A0A3M8DXV8_9BACL|nr:response regulator transcription factor [Brevibacillus fluminis]RNB92359.1 DNA-binding response regulator [Brevibacillus fluminis]
MKEHIIAVVDDDDNIREIVEAYLQKEGYRTVGLSTAEAAWELWTQSPPDLWILDIMLPGMDGYEFCRRIRNEAEVPIILISARDEEVDKILGLEMGSDDYLTKPFSPRELVARVKRHLHRWDALKRLQQGGRPAEPDAGKTEPGTQAVTTMESGELRLKLDERRVFWGADEIEITAKEFTLLQIMVERPNRAFARDELLTLVWGMDYFGSERAVDDLIKRLRKKMEGLPIETVWGYGYRLRLEAEE